MNRRGFLSGIIAAIACAAIPIGLKKEEDFETEYQRMVRENMEHHAKEIERAFLFGTDTVETAFGTIHFKRHPLFT